jgi:hypothetical protein
VHGLFGASAAGNVHRPSDHPGDFFNGLLEQPHALVDLVIGISSCV